MFSLSHFDQYEKSCAIQNCEMYNMLPWYSLKRVLKNMLHYKNYKLKGKNNKDMLVKLI